MKKENLFNYHLLSSDQPTYNLKQKYSLVKKTLYFLFHFCHFESLCALWIIIIRIISISTILIISVLLWNKNVFWEYGFVQVHEENEDGEELDDKPEGKKGRQCRMNIVLVIDMFSFQGDSVNNNAINQWMSKWWVEKRVISFEIKFSQILVNILYCLGSVSASSYFTSTFATLFIDFFSFFHLLRFSLLFNIYIIVKSWIDSDSMEINIFILLLAIELDQLVSMICYFM